MTKNEAVAKAHYSLNAMEKMINERDETIVIARGIEDELRAKVKAMEADRDHWRMGCNEVALRNETLVAQMKALESENAALKAKAAAPSEAWTDLPTYSYRRAGDVLLVAEQDGALWITYRYPTSGSITSEGDTRDEAKAILDAAVAPKKAPRYAVKETLGGDGWCVMRDGLVYSNGTMMRGDAERFAAAMNATEASP